MIGRWSFVLIARNQAGLEARDILQVVVRQYPGSRVVNHMFMATFIHRQANSPDPNFKWKVRNPIIEWLVRASDNRTLLFQLDAGFNGGYFQWSEFEANADSLR